MPISLSNLNKVTRFNFPNEEGEEWVELRLVSSEKMDEFRKKINVKPKSKYVVNTISKKMEVVQDVDIPEEKINEFNDMCIDYQIANWNLEEPDGKEIPCTLQNKKLLMGGEPVFDAWVNSRLRKLQGDLDELRGEEIKNS